MHRHFTSFCCKVAVALSATVASAGEISLEHGDLTLLADFVEAEDAAPQVALITHGTLAHKDMELVEALQDSLAEQGISSLAHTLSLGIDKRRGMYDCAVPHTHLDEDADAEIRAWVDWLTEKGHEEIALVGHSRGGKQVARVAATLNPSIDAVILIAPATQASAERSRSSLPEGVEIAVAELPDDAVEPVELTQFIYCKDATATPASIRSYYKSKPVGADSYIADVKHPTLIIAGSADAVVPDVPATFMPLRNDWRHFALIEDADHMFLDFYADDAATLIAAFLTDLPEWEPEESFNHGASENEARFAAADLSYGEYLGSECLSCHKPDGADGVPPLVGHDAAYLYAALYEYESGAREHAAMQLVAKSLDDDQRIAVAAYFASLAEK